MAIFDYSIKEKKDILLELETDPEKGLSQEESKKRLVEYGFNEILTTKLNGLNIFLRQFKSAFIYLLLAAMVITLILGDTLDALMIFIFLAINTILGFYQEYRSEKIVQFLNHYTKPKARVIRDGKVTMILSKELVPGDIIILETGDKIPADVRFIEEHNITVDETILTGESMTVHKNENVLEKKAESYYQALNLGFSGTDILTGKATAVVLATGKNTAFGKIAKLTTESRRISDFEKGISRFANFILKLVGLTLLVVFIANAIIKQGNFDLIELIIFSIALTISVIPEALPLVTTFSLSRGARNLADNKVLVKRLSAVEDLGGIEILCADKTGTLTKNELKVANILSEFPEKILLAANLASAFDQKQKLEPFDIALWEKLKEPQKKIILKNIKLTEEPFNPKTRRNIVAIQEDAKVSLITRGAPHEILNCCHKLSREQRYSIEQWVKKEGEQGHRVLVVGCKQIKKDSIREIDLEKEKNYEFSGAISFVDTIKPSSYEVVKKANKLGVKIKILTGDSVEVSGAVAHQIGLVESPQEVITGSAWEAMDEEKQIEALEKYSVFARVSPEQKYMMIEVLRKYYMVGFLGEGINDAPALKIAGVSIVVDSVADIAREAADIVLLKKNLTVILDGIEEGRKVFANTAKYIKATLTSNFGNFFAVATASLLIDYLPMLPIQILLLNLFSDSPMISIYSDNVDKDELLAPQKYEVKGIVLFSVIFGVLSMFFDFVFFGLFYHFSPGVLQTNWFIGSVLTELVTIFSVRTKSFFLKAGRPSGILISLTILVFLLTIILPFTFLGQKIFHFTRPAVSHLALILVIVGIYFICFEFVKLMFYKETNNRKLI